jgi:hypothetical protein
MMARLLIASGCYGDGGHVQRLDNLQAVIPSQNLVWRRSFPHFAGQERTWPDPQGMAARFSSAGFLVHTLVTTRDWTATAPSQVAAEHVSDLATAQANLQEAYRRIFAGLGNTPFTMVSYESLTTNPQASQRLIQSLGLPFAEHEVLTDENRKWFSESSLARNLGG